MWLLPYNTTADAYAPAYEDIWERNVPVGSGPGVTRKTHRQHLVHARAFQDARGLLGPFVGNRRTAHVLQFAFKRGEPARVPDQISHLQMNGTTWVVEPVQHAALDHAMARRPSRARLPERSSNPRFPPTLPRHACSATSRG